MILGLHHDTATNEELIALCFSLAREVLGGAPYGNIVIKISDQAVVKFGVGVKEEEANNQRRAYELLNPSVVRIPRVYRFFVDERFGYLVMEYMKGQVLDPLEDLDCIYKIVYMLAQLAEINSCIPAHLVVVDHVVFFGLTGKYFPLVLSTIWKDFSIAEYHEATRKWHLKITGSEYTILMSPLATFSG